MSLSCKRKFPNKNIQYKNILNEISQLTSNQKQHQTTKNFKNKKETKTCVISAILKVTYLS